MAPCCNPSVWVSNRMYESRRVSGYLEGASHRGIFLEFRCSHALKILECAISLKPSAISIVQADTLCYW